MRKPRSIAAFACSLAALSISVPAEARINQRQNHQQQRIAKGISSGRLTPHETIRLERQQRHIARYEARNCADGGGLNVRERARIEAKQDRASARIYRQKHDRQGR
jgi:hypothetical protein